jgi:2-polyprenyl-6-methoxyphenol hydroxylase-like FAD-dependent oxidoreductase
MGSEARMRAIIIGAGIGGATAAIALVKAGLDVTVYERAPEPREVGAGISIWSNAIAALRRIAAAEAVLAAGEQMMVGELRTDRGAVLSRADMAALDRPLGEHGVLIHRADLLAALLGRLPEGAVRFGRTLTEWREQGGTSDGSGVRVNARFDTGEEDTADLLIGADGINSAVRRMMKPGEAPPRYAGYTCWRGLCEFPESRWAHGRICEAWGRGARFGITRLGSGPAAVNGRGRIYWFAVANAPQGSIYLDHKAELRRIFRGWFDPVGDIIEATPAEAIIHGDILDRQMPRLNKSMPTWSTRNGHVVLIGDAAHPTTPNLGQGACMAIEDGVLLGQILGRTLKPPTIDDAPHAMSNGMCLFEWIRYRRSRQIVNTSRLLGRMAHTESRTLCAMRNAFMRLSAALTARQHRQIAGYRLPEFSLRDESDAAARARP